MSLGELPARTTMRGYWKCADLTDSSGNSRTLSNLNTATFVAGKFGNAVSMGATGTNKALAINSNIMSGLKFTTCTMSQWVKLNTNANTTARWISSISTAFDSTGSVFDVFYAITSGVFAVAVRQLLTTTTAQYSYSFPSLPATTTWIHIVAVKTSTTTVELFINGISVGTHTGSGTETAVAGIRQFCIGNIAAVTAQGFLTIDEVIVEERAWSASEIRKYYTQGLGRLLITQ